MRPARPIAVVLLGGALCGSPAGCSTPVGRYFARRGRDLADCIEAEAGMGWPARIVLSDHIYGWDFEASTWPEATGVRPLNGMPSRAAICCLMSPPRVYGRLKVTDFAVIGCGLADDSVGYGWRGRYRVRGMAHAYEFGVPLIGNLEGQGRTHVGGHTVVETVGPCSTSRTYEPEDLGLGRGGAHILSYEPGARGKVADRFWCGATATFLLSARLDLNPAEFIDFVAGCFGWDLLRDDDWEPKDEVISG